MNNFQIRAIGETSKKLLRHKLKTSCDPSAAGKNVSPFTSFRSITSNLALEIHRGIESDIKTRFSIPAPGKKFLGLNHKISLCEEFQLQLRISLELGQVSEI